MVGCERSVSSLCTLVGGGTVFPSNSVDANVVFGAGDKCTEAFTGRTMQLEGVSSITLCNILTGGQRVFFMPSGDIHIGESMVGPKTQLLISMIAVGLVGGVVFRFTGGDPHVAGGGVCTVLCFFSILLVAFLGDPWALYTTEQDRACFVFLIIYSIFNLVRWVVRHYRDPKYHPPYSLSVGALNLLSFRMYSTVDNPCSPFIMAFVIARVLQQLRSCSHQQDAVGRISLHLDATLLSLLVNYGFAPQYDSELKAGGHLLLITTVIIMVFSP